MNPQTIIARRIAEELSAGHAREPRHWDLFSRAANYLPAGMQVFFQSEYGLIGTGVVPEGCTPLSLTSAAGRPVTALPGASTFDSAMSFGLIRGGQRWT